MANFLFNSAKKSFFGNGIDWDNDTLKILLVNNNYTPMKSHKTVQEVIASSSELSGSGYSRKELANCKVTQDDLNDRALLSSDSVSWKTINAGTVKGAVIYKENGSDGSNPVIAYIDENGFPIKTIGSNLILEFDNLGVIKFK